MNEFNLCDPHVLKPVEQSKVLLMKPKGIQEGFYELWVVILRMKKHFCCLEGSNEMFTDILNDYKNNELNQEKQGNWEDYSP